MTGEPQQPVPLRDLEIAQRIAAAARSGGRAERDPTLERLLGEFEEPEPTPAARARIASALTLAGLRANPSLHEVHPGERVKLRTRPGGARGRLALGLAAVVAIAAAAAVAASATGGGGNGGTAAAPPAGTTATVPATTATHEITVTSPPIAKPKSNRRPKAVAKPKPKPKPKPPPAAPKLVVVTLAPGPQASYLCVDHGPGTPTIETTLASPRTFKGKRVRLNVGLSSVHVTVNGKPFILAGSPSGYDLAINHRAYLPQGQRPCA